MTPAFPFNILKQFSEIVRNESNRIMEELKIMKDTTVEDLQSFISHHTLNIICGKKKLIIFNGKNNFSLDIVILIRSLSLSTA